MHPASVLAVLLALPLAPLSGGSDWPQFRGASGTGVAPAADIPLEWSETKNVAWKVALGSGWSQPVVLGDVVFATAAVGERLERPVDFEKGVADPRTMKAGEPPAVSIDWQVIALDLKTGAVRWTQTATSGKPKFPIHPSNTYASETPAADANGVYAFFGATGTAAAFDHAGKALWKKELGAHSTANGYGTSSSPALHEGKLFVQCFNEETAFLVCLDARTGAEKWRATREKPGTSWSSPLVWRSAKRVEVVASGGRLTTSHDPETGKELWRAAGVDGPGMCSFAADAERLYFGQKAPQSNPPLYALAAGATGDLSPAGNSTDLKSQAWALKGSAPGVPSPVAVDGLLYVLADGLLSCHDAASGERLYKERLGEKGIFAASPIVVGDKLVALDEFGSATVLRVGPEFEVLGRGKLDDVFWSTPAVAGSALLLRGVDHLYCVRK